MTPFQAAWSLLKADSKELMEAARNRTSPDRMTPEEIKSEMQMLHENNTDVGSARFHREQFQRRNRDLFNAGIKNNNERTPLADELMARLMGGETLSTQDLDSLLNETGVNEHQSQHNGATNRPGEMSRVFIDGIDNKEELNERSIDRGWTEEEDAQAVREFVRNQPQKPNFGIPVNSEQTRLPLDIDRAEREGNYEPTLLDYQRNEDSFDRLRTTRDDWPEPPYRVGGDPWKVDQEVEMQRAGRRLKDQQAAAKLHLQNNPPRLERSGRSHGGAIYDMMSGYENAGHVGVDDDGGIGYGEVRPEYQRQGLYGRALQAIINDRGTLSSSNRNHNSQPFHEQFNPPNTTKVINEYDRDELPTDEVGIGYVRNEPEETPKNWGALEYDTGALPLYDQKPLEPENNLDLRNPNNNLKRWYGDYPN